MGGTMTFQESLKLRLDIIKPSMQQIKEFLLTKPPSLTPGIKYIICFVRIKIGIYNLYENYFRNLVQILHNKQIPIFLISGGFKCIIAPIAQQLNIPLENIYANRLKFYFTGTELA